MSTIASICFSSPTHYSLWHPHNMILTVFTCPQEVFAWKSTAVQGKGHHTVIVDAPTSIKDETACAILFRFRRVDGWGIVLVHVF